VFVAIDPADDRPIYLQIMDEVRRARVVGTLAAHKALPSVRQLASELRVNANTVAQAYRELEREGTVYVRRGQGTFAAASRADDGARERLVRDVAERARRDAYRHGIALDELIDALSNASADQPEEER